MCVYYKWWGNSTIAETFTIGKAIQKLNFFTHWHQFKTIHFRFSRFNKCFKRGIGIVDRIIARLGPMLVNYSLKTLAISSVEVILESLIFNSFTIVSFGKSA
jgi:hypothetical protein